MGTVELWGLSSGGRDRVLGYSMFGPGARDRVLAARCKPLTAAKENAMKGLMNRMKSFLKDEEGATATEYAVMLALIIVISLAAISALGNKVSTVLVDIESSMP